VGQRSMKGGDGGGASMMSNERGGALAPGSRLAAMVENEDASRWVRGWTCCRVGKNGKGGRRQLLCRRERRIGWEGPDGVARGRAAEGGGPTSTARELWSRVTAKQCMGATHRRGGRERLTGGPSRNLIISKILNSFKLESTQNRSSRNQFF
jgi:hypothetical protein